MNRNRWWIPAVILLGAGCATNVDMGELPADHPANPDAETAECPVPTVLLDRSLSLPDMDPFDDSKQHDHLQQKGHSGEDMMDPHDNQYQQHGHAKPNFEPVYACPKHPDETSPYVGNCMRCNRPLKQSIPQDKPTSATKESEPSKPTSSYLCTMHPALPLESPGLCPVCGMTLIKREAKRNE